MKQTGSAVFLFSQNTAGVLIIQLVLKFKFNMQRQKSCLQNQEKSDLYGNKSGGAALEHAHSWLQAHRRFPQSYWSINVQHCLII